MLLEAFLQVFHSLVVQDVILLAVRVSVPGVLKSAFSHSHIHNTG